MLPIETLPIRWACPHCRSTVILEELQAKVVRRVNGLTTAGELTFDNFVELDGAVPAEGQRRYLCGQCRKPVTDDKQQAIGTRDALTALLRLRWNED